MQRLHVLTTLLSLALFAGCDEPDPYAKARKAPIEFNDRAQQNVNVAADLLDLVFVNAQGQKVDLKQFRGQKHVVLVVTRGFSGSICPYCAAQTSRLITNYEQFTSRGAEVLVVFPGAKEHLPDFLSAAEAQVTADKKQTPFPILLDVDFSAVEHLGIRGNLAKPSTYIIDKEGNVRFAYVGATDSDRPSVKAMLAQLDAIPQE